MKLEVERLKTFFNFMKITTKKQNKGFTLLELMVSIGLFVVIVTIGIQAMLNTGNNYRKTQDLRSSMDGLSFVMEEMARNIRLGSLYHCKAFTGTMELPQDCDSLTENSLSIAFENVDGTPFDETGSNLEDQFIYRFIETDGIGRIEKSTDGGDSFLNMTPIDIDIDLSKSGFSVTGAEDPSDGIQPSVLIRASGVVTTKNNNTNFSIQTTVSQRAIESSI